MNIKQWLTRPRAANLMIASFIIMTTIGASIISIPVGFIIAGISCGVVGVLLGLE